MKQKEMYTKKFSYPHLDAMKDNDVFFRCFENSAQQWKSEIHDIYFGGTFMHRDVTFGDVMGENASDAQYRGLLKIQEKHGIPISLTLNEMNRPMRMVRPDVIRAFVSYLKKYHADGVRSCTISHTHLMRTGALQEAFPDMDWKNTVNHRVSTTQQFIDYAHLGYTTVQLDRSFNRNMDELRRVKKEADRLGVKTCLLIKENCMPECPFKTEHDCWQSDAGFRDLGRIYWEVIPFTCNKWRSLNHGRIGAIGGAQQEIDSGVSNPRTGTDIIARTKNDWREFASLVDVFKLSGRLGRYLPDEIVETFRYGFARFVPNAVTGNPFPLSKMFVAESFKDIYENDLAPLHMWFTVSMIRRECPCITDIEEIKKGLADHFWNSEESIGLCNVLKNCKNQCYRCHRCDEVFGTGAIDSCLELS